MAAFIIYIIRWAVCLTLLYSLFGLFMKRETLHGFNRIVLLFVLVASMVLPLCQIETGGKNIVSQSREMVEHQIANMQNPLSSDIKRATITSPENGMRYTHIPIREDANAYLLIAIAIYMAGLIACWLRYFWSLFMLARLIRQGKRIEVEGLPKYVHVITLSDIKTPCSWMRWMILNPADANTRAIINHELAHIRYGHSWDMLLSELTCRMLWCVPFAWMLRQDLRDVHEYQTDRLVLQSGINDEEYQLLLIKKATSTGLQPVVNAFNQSPIKRRFKMMYRKPSRRWMALKAVYLLPLSALALVAFARPQTMSEVEEKVEKTAPAVSEAVKETVKAVASLTGTVDLSGEESLMTGTLTSDNGEYQLEDAHYSREEVVMDTTATVGPDANLVMADLEESGPFNITTQKSATELLDSTMQAIGARKIADGTYIGHFQPNLNSDTMRIARASILDRQSLQTDEYLFAQNATDPQAYNITLNAETRKDRTGYYIRYLQPVNSTVRNFDIPEVDPTMLSTDSVLTKRSNKRLISYNLKPIAIEQTKQETRIFTYILLKNGQEDFVELLKRKRNISMVYPNLAIVDVKTGDRYVRRSVDYDYLKYVKDEIQGQDTLLIYQICFVFPPLDKRVKEIYFGNAQSNKNISHETYRLKDIPRKPRIITK